MSVEQFQKFYWPSLRKVIDGLVADGFVPYLFAEGAYGTRWRPSPTCPRGGRCGSSTTPTCAGPRQILGGMACIQGNVPSAAAPIGDGRGSQSVLPGSHRGGRAPGVDSSWTSAR